MAKQPSSNQSQVPAAARVLGWVAIIVWVEAAIVAAFAAFLLWGLLSGQSKTVSGELILTLLYALVAGWVAYVAAQVRAGKRWARSGAIFWQTCQGFIGIQSFLGIGANYLIGGVLCGLALAALVLLFNPRVIASSRQEISGR